MKLKSHLHRSVLVVNNVDADKKAQLRNPKTGAALERNAVIRNVKSTEIIYNRSKHVRQLTIYMYIIVQHRIILLLCSQSRYPVFTKTKCILFFL